ncbi:hypothetical protein BC628DRAFT_1353136 [Trametes gibbosa]|nr:hypothetical protein BC628DRAFT_1353136 [Trametes gibbosa]
MDLPAADLLLTRTHPTPLNPPQHTHRKAEKGNIHLEKAHGSPPDSDLAERPNKDDDDAGKNTHKSSSSSKDKSKSAGKDKTPEINANAVPVPAPDTGTHGHVISPGILPVNVIPAHAPTTLTVSGPYITPGFSPLPSLTALGTAALTSTLASSGTPTSASRALSGSHADHARGKDSKHLPIVLIVLVSVGIGFLALGAYIILRARSRPRQRTCPTPSLPIFQDPFADQDLKVDEESLFGGKDRASAVARPNSNGLWTWTQYTPKPSAQELGTGSLTAHLAFPEPPKGMPSGTFSQRAAPPPPAPVHVPLPVNPPPSNPPMQQMQSALSRAANRVSALSMSIYPTSPQSTAGIGLAFGGMSPLTADGTPVLQRKPSASRLSKGGRSVRHSLAATEYLDMHADIYGGAQIISPYMPSPQPQTPNLPTPLPKSALRKSNSISAHAQGRARVKAPYAPGTGGGLRASSTVAGIATLARGNRSSVMVPSVETSTSYILPPLSPALKSPARRERDTRALASAMGLATPDPDTHVDASALLVSPQPTLYPDDSITLAGDRQRAPPTPREKNGTRPGAHGRVQSEVMSPGMEASARLGNLMLAEFTSMASLPSTRTVVNAQGSVPASGSKSRVVPRKNVGGGGNGNGNDRPPRVPSPPPLPSLAQMAMAHANTQEYADYRSPTYSIYGLYETERKSRMPSEAGF